jgi:hypothetical protein
VKMKLKVEGGEGEEAEAHLCMLRIGDLHSPLPALQSLRMDKQYHMDQDL